MESWTHSRDSERLPSLKDLQEVSFLDSPEILWQEVQVEEIHTSVETVRERRKCLMIYVLIRPSLQLLLLWVRWYFMWSGPLPFHNGAPAAAWIMIRKLIRSGHRGAPISCAKTKARVRRCGEMTSALMNYLYGNMASRFSRFCLVPSAWNTACTMLPPDDKNTILALD